MTHVADLTPFTDWPVGPVGEQDGHRPGPGETALAIGWLQRGRDGERFVAPALIAHYIAEHGYLPPPESVAAALHGPDAADVAC